MAGAQQIEEIQPALRWPRAEPGEPIIADLRAEAVRRFFYAVRRCHPPIPKATSPIPLAARSRASSRSSHHAWFCQQPLDLTLGDRQTNRTPTRRSDGAMLIDPGDIASARTGADQDRSAPWSPRAAARRSFGRPVSPNARAGSGSRAPTAQAPGPDRRLIAALKRDPAGTGAFSTRSSTLTRGRTLPRPKRFSCLSGLPGSVALSMPLGLMSGRPFSPFSRAISSRCSAIVRSSSASFANTLATNSRSWIDDRPSSSTGGRTHRLNPTRPRRGKHEMQPRPGFCPCYSECR